MPAHVRILVGDRSHCAEKGVLISPLKMDVEDDKYPLHASWTTT